MNKIKVGFLAMVCALSFSVFSQTTPITIVQNPTLDISQESTDALNAQVEKVNLQMQNYLFSPENMARTLNLSSLSNVNAFSIKALNDLNFISVTTITSAVQEDITFNRVTLADLNALKFAKDLSIKMLDARKIGQSKTIFVNISDFTLYALNTADGSIVFESEVIVGKPNKKTPRFNTNIVSMTVNPTWTPTASILKASVYPSIGKTKGYASRTGMVAVDSDGNVVNLNDPNVSRSDLKGLRIYQPAGDDNALGVMRFNTDNKENIYLHDTNERHLFKNPSRAYSHGCVRVQEWEKLALWLSGWDSDKLHEKLDANATASFRVDKVLVSIVDYPVKVSLDGVETIVDPYASN